ncbi:MAG: hypothetical protein HC898_10060 [Phycisphaerales bacterium]|nr:hypothetical protein [Phycisphaerales bacterium]
MLLSLNLWMMWTQSEVRLDTEAQAQPTLPDPGMQRAETIKQLQQVNEKLAEMNALFKGGTARVRVESMPEK